MNNYDSTSPLPFCSHFKPYKLQLCKNGDATLSFRTSQVSENTKSLVLPISDSHLSSAIQTLSISIFNSVTNTSKQFSVTYLPQPPVDVIHKPFWRRILSSFSNPTLRVTDSIQHTAKVGKLLGVYEDEAESEYENSRKGCIILGDVNDDENTILLTCFESDNFHPIHITPEENGNYNEILSNIYKEGYKNAIIALGDTNKQWNSLIIEAEYSFVVQNCRSPFHLSYKAETNELDGNACGHTNQGSFNCYVVTFCPTSFSLEDIQLELVMNGKRAVDQNFVQDYNFGNPIISNSFVNESIQNNTNTSSSILRRENDDDTNKKKISKKRIKHKKRMKMNENWFITNESENINGNRFNQHNNIHHETHNYKYNKKISLYPNKSTKIPLFQRDIEVRVSYGSFNSLLLQTFTSHKLLTIRNSKKDEVLYYGPANISFSTGKFDSVWFPHTIKNANSYITNTANIVCLNNSTTDNRNKLHLNLSITNHKYLNLTRTFEKITLIKLYNRELFGVLLDYYFRYHITQTNIQCISYGSWDDFNCDRKKQVIKVGAKHPILQYQGVNLSLKSNETRIVQVTEQYENERIIPINSSEVTFKRIYSFYEESISTSTIDSFFEILRLRREIRKFKRIKKRLKYKLNTIQKQQHDVMNSKSEIFNSFFRNTIDKDCKEKLQSLDEMNDILTLILVDMAEGFQQMHKKLKIEIAIANQKILDLKLCLANHLDIL